MFFSNFQIIISFTFFSTLLAHPTREITGPHFTRFGNNLQIAMLIENENRFVDATTTDLSEDEVNTILLRINTEFTILDTQEVTLDSTERYIKLLRFSKDWIEIAIVMNGFSDFLDNKALEDMNWAKQYIESSKDINMNGLTQELLQDFIIAFRYDLREIEKKRLSTGSKYHMKEVEILDKLRIIIYRKVDECVQLIYKMDSNEAYQISRKLTIESQRKPHTTENRSLKDWHSQKKPEISNQ